jgi:hypothetical protein
MRGISLEHTPIQNAACHMHNDAMTPLSRNRSQRTEGPGLVRLGPHEEGLVNYTILMIFELLFVASSSMLRAEHRAGLRSLSAGPIRPSAAEPSCRIP